MLALFLVAGGCAGAQRGGAGDGAAGGALLVCGERVPVDFPVVLPDAEPFLDARLERPRWAARGPEGKRYRPGREGAAHGDGPRTREALRELVDLLVVHYDAAGSSRECFRILHDVRGLSTHFLVDVDGTVYQTLDLADQAWHAGAVNRRAVGVEVAHLGAWPPAAFAERGRAPGEDRGAPVRGRVQGRELLQEPFTDAQYEALAALAAALVEELPRIVPAVPRGPGGGVRPDALPADELARWHGIVGHWHVSPEKVDPGPAFDWERFLGALRRRLGR